MSRPLIRSASPGDLTQIVDLARRFMEESRYGEILRFNQERIEDLVYQVITEGVCYVACTGYTVHGFIAGLLMRHPMDGTIWLDELAWYVHPDQRSGRTGYNLLRFFEWHARQAGVDSLRMLAPATAPEVGEFYYRLGYSHAEQVFVKRLSHGTDDGAPAGRRARGDGRAEEEGRRE